MSSSSENDMTWPEWFCSLRGNEFFCEIDNEYLYDRFNSTGVQEYVPLFEESIEMILDNANDDLADNRIMESAVMLYGLMHARFILTTRGQQKMIKKYRSGEFGTCSLYDCHNQPFLPVGLSDVPKASTVKLYCPKCECIYIPRSNRHINIDGAYFGTTFPHLLIMAYPEFRPPCNTTKYVPKIYGFSLHPKAMQIQYDQSNKKNGRRDNHSLI